MNNLKIWRYISSPWLIFSSFFFIAFFFLSFSSDIESEYINNRYLTILFLNTILLSLLTGLISALIAIPLAILVTFYKFPGHQFFNWSLSLSIAFPVYVYSFIYVGIFEYSSPISELFRNFNIYLPSLKNLIGASIIMSMALFPYIFILVKAQLSTSGTKIFKAAKTLGQNNIQAIYKVILPSMRPAIIGGITLVMFETISDFGGVSTLRVDTFTIGIYEAWFGYQSYVSAVKLAGYLMIYVLFLMFLGKSLGVSSEYLASKSSEEFEKIELSKRNKYLSFLVCLVIFVFVFCIPLVQLITWSFSSTSIAVIGNLSLIFNSLLIGLLVAGLTVFIAMSLALSYQSFNKIKLVISITTSGYAIPGSVISAGLLFFFDYFFNTSLTTIGIFGLILCLSVRFMTPPFNYLLASLKNMSQSSMSSLSLMPTNSYKAFKQVLLPQIRPGLVIGFMIVFIESIKEQPATLLLRPVGFDTLSTKIYNYTSEGQWILASSPSIILIFISLIFVYLINKGINSKI